MIKNTRTRYYKSIISNNSTQKIFFKAVNKLLRRRPEMQYPTTPSKTELVNKFTDFISNKITTIRNELITGSFHFIQLNLEHQYVQVE